MGITLRCIDCGKEFEPSGIYECSNCGGIFDVVPDLDFIREKISKRLFDSRLGSREFPYRSGVWRFRELIHPLVKDKEIVSRPEGDTNLYSHKKVIQYTGIENIFMKHEGENPTGSFKDRGMTAGISEAKRLGMNLVACASTGNTSASMAAYASMAGMRSIVFIPEGEIAFGKLSQAMAYGAQVFQVSGNFDDAMSLVQKSSRELGIYLLNSINPWRVEGQKSIMFELIQQLNWSSPDWVVVPAGNLGNTSAFGKAFDELEKLELIEEIPRIASIQATGADPFYRTWKEKKEELKPVKDPETIATAIKIGNPVSWKKALRTIKLTNGIVEEVTDQEIMDAKAVIDSSGIGCEPASAASVAGAKKLVESGMIDKKERVVCIITGNILKDPDATINYHLGKLKGISPRFPNNPVVIEASLDAVRNVI
ncbi:MAG: threonine synthase [Candidatus Altiarchaeales archaeon]|nr:MAG: threonine synthase [Candidatus Altiarchaeales archaeon]